MITKQEAIAIAKKQGSKFGKLEKAQILATAPTAIFFFKHGIVSVGMLNGKTAQTYFGTAV